MTLTLFSQNFQNFDIRRQEEKCTGRREEKKMKEERKTLRIWNFITN